MARAGQRASPANTNTRVHIRDQNTGLQNSYTTEFSIVEETVQHLASRGLHILKSSRQLRLDFNLAHMPCLACLSCVCADACVSECLHVVEMVEWCKSRWLWIFPACSSAPVHPWGGPHVFMGKSRLHFRRHSQGHCGCIGNIENSNTRLTWGTPVPNTAEAVTSHARRNSVLLSDCQKLTSETLALFTYDATWKETTPCWQWELLVLFQLLCLNIPSNYCAARSPSGFYTVKVNNRLEFCSLIVLGMFSAFMPIQG